MACFASRLLLHAFPGPDDDFICLTANSEKQERSGDQEDGEGNMVKFRLGLIFQHTRTSTHSLQPKTYQLIQESW